MSVLDPQWAEAGAAVLGLGLGVGSGLFMGGWRFGRIEGRLKLHFQQAIEESERRIEEKMTEATKAFDETLRAMRQKMVDTDNDVVEAKLEAERRFLLKDDFHGFREENRQDMHLINTKLDRLLARK